MILDGIKVAEYLKQSITQEVEKLSRKPGLAVILVGDDAGSQVYVSRKEKGCKDTGFYSEKTHLPSSTTQEQLLEKINSLNKRDDIDGILVQLPLPSHINADLIISSIDPKKDVDGFHYYNIGRLVQKSPYGLRPCTPRGIMTMLDKYGINLVGKDALVIGASYIVGRPMALELINAGATVTIAHSKTKNLQDKIKNTEILVVAVGVPNFIRGEWLKQGIIAIDVGINRLPNGKIVGDIDFESCKDKCAFITPVPGGVGPMTIATLLENTLNAYKSRQ